MSQRKESGLPWRDFGGLFEYPPSLLFLLSFVSPSISILSPPPPPFRLVLYASLLPTLLCNLIHLVMAPDQYPFSLASGRASWICSFRTVVVLASRGSHGPAGWYRCSTIQYLRKQSRAYDWSLTNLLYKEKGWVLKLYMYFHISTNFLIFFA